jgi:hypothetical protein
VLLVVNKHTSYVCGRNQCVYLVINTTRWLPYRLILLLVVVVVVVVVISLSFVVKSGQLYRILAHKNCCKGTIRGPRKTLKDNIEINRREKKSVKIINATDYRGQS